MKIFRAVPREGFNPAKVYKAHASARLPGNVPYLVDNLWELTRPAGKPSRRHAVFACPKPELTVGNAAAGGLSPDKYVPCELIFSSPAPVAFQLSERDARYHRDVYQLPKLVNGKLPDFASLDHASKYAYAALFLPGTTVQELMSAMESCPELRKLIEEVTPAVSMWSDAPNLEEGEITFELGREHSYTLRQL